MKNNGKVAIIGKYDTQYGVSDGQAVKTTIVAEEIERSLGKDKVKRISTFEWKKNPLKLFCSCVLAVWRCKNVLFITDEGGIRVFPKLLRYANVSGKCKIHYYVVGGWLHNYLDRDKKAAEDLKKLDAIYVEIPAMLRELEERGFRNGVLLNKFRRMTPAEADGLRMNHTAPYRLCYFSRVMKEKGIEECVEAVKIANRKAGFEKYTLDIYGYINDLYKDTFDGMLKEFPTYISYKGIVDYQNSTHILSEYFAMLFPTYYTSEGYPNTVVDAYAAGLPVIATRWNYNSDIIRDGEDGIMIDIGSAEQIVDAVEYLSDNPQIYAKMRANCLARCKEFLPENAISKVLEKMRA